jgi:outer membrane cobalamin receptor
MKTNPSRLGAFLAAAASLASAAEPPAPTQLETVVVTGRADSLVGTATSSNEGVIGAEQLARRPLQRVGEIVETIPGVIISQHAGGGKANQFYLRGFNLDHGTDLATTLDGMPINMPTHAHGQGYTDLNLLIPELVREVSYKKGP